MIGNEYTVDWTPYLDTEWDDAVDTTVSPKLAADLGRAITTIPPDVRPHGRVQRIMDDRVKMASGEADMDWGFAETMAYASLLMEGHNVRLVARCGRDMQFDRFEEAVTSPLQGFYILVGLLVVKMAAQQ